MLSTIQLVSTATPLPIIRFQRARTYRLIQRVMMADVCSKRLIQCWPAALAALLLAASVTGGSAGSTSSSEHDELLREHNKVRAAVGVDPLRWNQKLADQATRWASAATCPRPASCPQPASCDLSEAASKSQLYGANQAVEYVMASAETVVGGWVKEGRQFYDNGNNTCAAGHEKECGSFTQVVWRNTLELGCGTANCGIDGSLFICLYFPRGNVPGQYPY